MIRVVVERVVTVNPWRTRIIEERSLEDEEEAEEVVAEIIKDYIEKGYNCEASIEAQVSACRRKNDMSTGTLRVRSKLCTTFGEYIARFCVKNNGEEIISLRTEYGKRNTVLQLLERLGFRNLRR